ncbi:hypothetical protein [Spirosoma radiotolerans]|uniref:Uncharacterized protein n=1 Tax=Spirosoma radiotolerans TaxID=1379870 RepID=A0A0E3V709_9BACT|nr:hypothetical protein [Spirosoma radiotolerans]AKD55011.1 hypothetical protein SD10_08950 [Spirosoma radiotolerans]
MNAEIIPQSRVRVAVHRRGFHVRNFTGTVIGWTSSGLIKVMEDKKDKARCYSSEHVKLIRQ